MANAAPHYPILNLPDGHPAHTMVHHLVVENKMLHSAITQALKHHSDGDAHKGKAHLQGIVQLLGREV